MDPPIRATDQFELGRADPDRGLHVDSIVTHMDGKSADTPTHCYPRISMGTPKRERQKANRAQKLAAQAVQQKQEQRKRSLTGLLVVLGAVVVVGLLIWFANSGDDSDTASTTTAPSVTTAGAELAERTFTFGTTPCPPEDGVSEPVLTFDAPPKNCLVDGKEYRATFTTTEGTVEVTLDTDKTPGTTNNFVFLARNRYYDDTVLFRADASIDIVQGGSPHTQSNSDPGPGYALLDEGRFNEDSSLGEYTYTEGDLVMARTTGRDGAGAQFFFVTGPNGANLDSQGTYVVFGHVTSGLDILQKMVAGVADKGTDVPDPEVTVKTVRITQS